MFLNQPLDVIYLTTDRSQLDRLFGRYPSEGMTRILFQDDETKISAVIASDQIRGWNAGRIRFYFENDSYITITENNLEESLRILKMRI